MKKILIILGIFIILIAGAAWTYVFLYGPPQSVDEVFGRFSQAPDRPGTSGSSADDGYIDTGDDDGNGAGDTSGDARQRLYQLTTRPVAGATIVGNTIRYVERGTGHVYEIALTGGSERIISGTTIPRTIRAVFSGGSGDHIALTSEYETGLITTLGSLRGVGGGGGTLDLIELPEGAREVGFATSSDNLRFFVPNASGGTGYAYDIAGASTVELFSLPLRDVRIQWGAKMLVYTTPSAYAMGYVYHVGKGGLEYITEGGKGLMAYGHASGTIVSSLSNGKLVTRDPKYGSVPLLTLFPEKCTVVIDAPRFTFCASPSSLPQGTYPDDWYKGVIGFTDAILRVDVASSTATVLSVLEDESGRPIDVWDIGTNEQGTLIHFINKYDGALWMLDLR